MNGDYFIHTGGGRSFGRNRKRADMLWLIYDYKTEMEKRMLPHDFSDDSDDSKAVVREEHQRLAKSIERTWAMKIARMGKKYGIPQEVMIESAQSPLRVEATMQERIELFERLKDKGRIFL
jgi:hypothetical protein